jgi:rubrerythrin
LTAEDGGRRLAAVVDHLLSIAVGKESEMSDFYEPAGEHMQEEPADELDRL